MEEGERPNEGPLGDQALPPGGLGDMGSGGQDSPVDRTVKRRVRASGNFCFSPHSPVGVLETGFLPTLDYLRKLSFLLGKTGKLSGEGKRSSFAGTQTGGGQFGIGVHRVVRTPLGEDPIRDADTPNTFCPQCSLQSPSEQGLAQRLRQVPVVRTLSFPPSFRRAENHGESYFRPMCNYAVKSRIKRH